MGNCLYRLEIHATREDMPVVREGLEKKLKVSGLSDNVRLDLFVEEYVDHGMNPLVDSDMRPYFRISNPKNEEIFQIHDVLVKFGPSRSRSFEPYFSGAVAVIGKDMRLNV